MTLYHYNHGIGKETRDQLTEQEYAKLLKDMREIHRELELDIHEDTNGVEVWFRSNNFDDFQTSSLFSIGYLSALGFDSEGKRSNVSEENGKPKDYEPCGTCGFDHSYETEEANRRHYQLLNKEG